MKTDINKIKNMSTSELKDLIKDIEEEINSRSDVQNITISDRIQAIPKKELKNIFKKYKEIYRKHHEVECMLNIPLNEFDGECFTIVENDFDCIFNNKVVKAYTKTIRKMSDSLIKDMIKLLKKHNIESSDEATDALYERLDNM